MLWPRLKFFSFLAEKKVEGADVSLWFLWCWANAREGFCTVFLRTNCRRNRQGSLPFDAFNAFKYFHVSLDE